MTTDTGRVKQKEFDRRKNVTSSEIAGVMGMSRWTTPLSLYYEKIGETVPDEGKNKEAKEWGQRHERTIGEKFQEDNNVKLRRYKHRYRHPQYPYLSCELDFIIEGTDEFVEAKTCIEYKKDEWEGDEMPQEYILQVNFALGITGRKRAWVAVLIGGNKYKQTHVDFDQELFDTQVEAAVDFWENHVLKRVPPVAIAGDEEILGKLYPKHRKKLEEVEDPDLDSLLSALQQVKTSIKDLKKKKSGIQAKIEQKIGDKEGYRTPSYKVTWKKQTSRRASTKKLKEAGIYHDYSYENSYKVLRVYKNKKKEEKK